MLPMNVGISQCNACNYSISCCLEVYSKIDYWCFSSSFSGFWNCSIMALSFIFLKVILNLHSAEINWFCGDFTHCPRFPLLAPRESGSCLSPCVADHPERPAKNYWLSRPLPDQLPNTTQVHQTARFSFLQDLAQTAWQIPTHYAPICHFVLNCSHLPG